MNEYDKVFSELRYEVLKVSALNAFLNAALAFFISNIVFTVIRERYIYSLVPAIIVFAISFFTKMRQYTLKRIEEGNPEVAEILRTAHDNAGKDNLLVHGLFMDLIQKMETVSAGVFIDAKQTTVKLGVIAFLAFVPLLITSFVPFLIVDNPLAGLSVQSILRPGSEVLAPTAAIGDAGNRDIYGNPEVVALGNEKLDITARSGGGGVDLSQKQDASGNSFRYNDYPVQPEAQQTTAGTGGKASDSALINEYSCKTKGQC